MSNTVIKVENISKQYRLGQVGTGTISHDLNRWWHRIRGKEDPYLKIGATNDRAQKGSSEYVWALKDINFEVQQGEVLGIIGKNGAGKSTLLKILSKVTGPTTGIIKAKGRIASLLEVGTGFHPELTGRENIYLNGTILGMTKAEVKAKLDEIVAFAGVERYLDTPVKRYSSGMMVRLGFAVAAHLEPEILIVDEVLAVGDAEFQKKAIGKMQEVSQGQGRTVLFVSHNMGSVKRLCKKCIHLHNGSIEDLGNTERIVEKYLSKGRAVIKADRSFSELQIGAIQLIRVQIMDLHEKKKSYFQIAESFAIIFDFISFENLERVDPIIRIDNLSGQNILISKGSDVGLLLNLESGKPQCFKVEFSNLNLMQGQYLISIYFRGERKINFAFFENVIGFEIDTVLVEGAPFSSKIMDGRWGIVTIPATYQVL